MHGGIFMGRRGKLTAQDVSLRGIEYEAGVELIGKKVYVRYDPFDERCGGMA